MKIEASTEEELLIGSLRLLDSNHAPLIKDLRLHDWQLLVKQIVSVPTASPRLLYLNLSHQLLCGLLSWHIADLFL